MATSFDRVYDDLKRFVSGFGVQVREKPMDVEKPGEFDGLTITINPRHEVEAACYYLAHSFGSISQWSTDAEHARKVFEDVRDARGGGTGTARFELAVKVWRVFEQTSSEHAVWTLDEIGHHEVIRSYTVFFRADIEAMTIFHRTGKEPPWPDFFSDWKTRVERGEIGVVPFRPKPVARFRPVRIEKQEVLQERD